MVVHGWRLGSRATRSMAENLAVPTSKDFAPNIEQKGADLRIELDIARVSLQRMADVIAVVTGVRNSAAPMTSTSPGRSAQPPLMAGKMMISSPSDSRRPARSEMGMASSFSMAI